MMQGKLQGRRSVLRRGQTGYPAAFERLADPPEPLYVLGNADALVEGLAIVGARKATPYGTSCAQRFAQIAARKGIVVISGGANGCDAAAHRAALAAGCPTVVFLGGGFDQLYPRNHAGLFQLIVDAGGALISEYAPDEPPLPYRFRARNRLIACLAKATLIVEAGLPSGTFSTADEALSFGRDVWAVPGAITSTTSAGANRLIAQGALPVIDDEAFETLLFAVFGTLASPPCDEVRRDDDPLVAAVRAEPLTTDQLLAVAERLCDEGDPVVWMTQRLAAAEMAGEIARYPDGRYGPAS